MSSSKSPPESTRFQILALDGGGIKGIFSAAVLAAIEEDLGTTVADHFDLVAGTSTGGIIALALGLGLSPRQVLEFYLLEGPVIFSNPVRLRSLRQYLHCKFSAGPLATALQKYFGAKRFGDSSKRLVIPAYNLGDDDVYIFRTPHHKNLRRDYKVPAWKVGLATSAAPTYVPATRCVDNVRLIDGGVWANNPTMVALVEAFGPLGMPLSAIRVLSLGTSDEINDRSRRLDVGGFWQWKKAVVDVVMRGQSLAATNQARFLLGEGNLLRINPPVPAGALALDVVGRADDLIARAAHFSRREMPAIQARFTDHTAPEFTPIYQ
ncbi:MAG: patatin-like phospholipase family protein [Bryobacterales bacterium]|nr:patatin-like phospholipase family protein [Bryobacterales bacterium]